MGKGKGTTHMEPVIILVKKQESLLESYGLPDFHLDKRPLQDALAEEENKVCRGFHAVLHPVGSHIGRFVIV